MRKCSELAPELPLGLRGSLVENYVCITSTLQNYVDNWAIRESKEQLKVIFRRQIVPSKFAGCRLFHRLRKH